VLFSALTTQPAHALKALDLCSLYLGSWLVPDRGDHETIRVSSGLLSLSRLVKYKLPEGTPPPAGWPAVFVFQGSFSPIRFDAETQAFGVNYQAELIRQLTRQGFAVIVPTAIGGVGWVTNLPPLTMLYEFSSDFGLIKQLLGKIDNGDLGPIDKNQLFATGISSGGYNASRMGIQFPGRFKALAIHSASYATCFGPDCSIPKELPSYHPPTLLISGEKDRIVPLFTVKKYHDVLEENHILTELHVNRDGDHEWFEESPDLIVNWFRRFLNEPRQ
jgi:poly(3-hydroxybutyrate) depolymerase